MDLSIVMPVYDERDVIRGVLRAIRAAAPEGADLVAYDDGSRDGTSQILDEIAREGWLRVIHGAGNRGYDAAVTAALAAATGDLIHLTDSDGQHDPADLRRLQDERERHGADLVVGWKKPRRDAWGRLVLSFGMNRICRLFFRSPLHDANCGFRLMTREVRDALLPRTGKLPTFISTEISLRAVAAGFRVSEVPVTHRARASGKSRSLPVARLPRILCRVGLGFVRLHRELRALRPRDEM